MQLALAEEDRSIEHLKETIQGGRMSILGVRADTMDSETALSALHAFAVHGAGGRPARVFFTNVHTIHVARRYSRLTSIINDADLVLPDGSGLKIAGKLFGTPVLENLNGTDLTPKLLAAAASEGLRVYLLGSQARVVQGCAHALTKMFPALQIVGFHHGHFSSEEEDSIVDEINACHPHILLVALGTPLQERWIAHQAARLNVGLCMGVGGLFNFLSGAEVRAPLWMRRAGIEWIYRFFRNPKSKWDRVFIEIPVFLGLILAKRLASRETRPFFTGKGMA
jgi:N-acetylglucosaminyldiphosphoundecaprenol N-acetyl-beta-D-mannosaminyltransferase